MTASEADKRRFREEEEKRDKETLDERVERWAQIESASFDKLPSNLAWYYLTEIDYMFIHKSFIGTVLLSAALAEMILTDQVKANLKTNNQKLKNSRFESLISQGLDQKIVKEDESIQLNALRILRNNLIHSKADQLDEMVTLIDGFKYKDSGFYFYGFGDSSIEKDALKFVTLVRNLSVRFYGVNNSP
jgi:hypothetical protein